MKKIIPVLIILVLSITLVSCRGVDKTYVEVINEVLETVIPEHIKYIEADKELDNFHKKARIKACRRVLKLSRDEKERVKE